MKVIVIKNNLKEGLAAAGRIAGENSQLPILKNILFETIDNKILLTATNLEIAIKFFVSGKIIENGSLAVPMSLFSGIINAISSERLNLETVKNILEIKTDNYRATVNSAMADEFPLIPKVKNTDNYLEIDSNVLKNALAQVVIASQFSELRPELNSIFVEYSIDSLKLVSTDSFRLAEKIIGANQINSTSEESFNFLLPIQSAHELLRILGADEKVRIYHDESQVLFKTERWELFSRLLEGTFPDYKAVVPKKYGAEIMVSKEEFLNSLKLSGIFSAKTSEVKIKILENQKALEISSADQTLGDNSYLLPAKLSGSSKEVSFNWKYLSEGLKAVEAEEVFFGLNEDNKPAVIKSIKDTSYFYLVMPILKA